MTATTVTPFPVNDHDPDDLAAMRRQIDSLRQQVARLAYGADYLNPYQVNSLLARINPNRVSTEAGMAHLQAYDVRRVLISVFGFGRWSADVVDSWQLYERVAEHPDNPRENPGMRIWVGYRVRLRLTVCAPNGTVLATYTEEACGDAKNFPLSKQGDAHDFALKTAESQALKRCAVNLGDQFGLSLYNKGSRDALVVRTLIDPRQDPAPLTVPAANGMPRNADGPGVDEHITEPLAPEQAPDAGSDDPRTMNSSPDTPDPAPAAAPPPGAPADGGEPVSGGDSTPDPRPADVLYAEALEIRRSGRPAGEQVSLLGEALTAATQRKLKSTRVGPDNRTLQSVLMGMLGDARRDHDVARAQSDGAGGSE